MTRCQLPSTVCWAAPFDGERNGPRNDKSVPFAPGIVDANDVERAVAELVDNDFGSGAFGSGASIGHDDQASTRLDDARQKVGNEFPTTRGRHVHEFSPNVVELARRFPFERVPHEDTVLPAWQAPSGKSSQLGRNLESKGFEPVAALCRPGDGALHEETICTTDIEE
jgi:hypothetical protein